MFTVLLPLVPSVPNKGLRLATGAFHSSITSLHVESNVLPLYLHRESLAVKALLRPYFLPSSPLRSLLTSEDLASSSWKFALLVHPDCLMRASWILTFWSSNSRVPLPGLFFLFVSIYFCRSWSKLPTFLLSYDLLFCSMHSCIPHLFPYILMGSNLVRVWAVSLFFLFIYLSLFL